MTFAETRVGGLPRFTNYEKVLVALFVITLPLSNPWPRGDGVGYYAFARSLLIEHRLDFSKDWLAANESFRMNRVDASGQLKPSQYTSTGHIDNHFAIGPAILWLPFLAVAHAGVLTYDHFGGQIGADGFSKPYRMAMALATTLYGFLAVFISFRLARRYVTERWAFLAALGIWFGSSLPVYMYFNPSWSHAPSAFAVALFLWYWMSTRGGRNWQEWMILGLMGGLMMDCYYLNAILLLLPFFESLRGYWNAAAGRTNQPRLALLSKNAIFTAAVFVAFLPTLITKKIIYGGYLKFGYGEHWYWRSPAFFKVCFSSNHGLFSWTPILVLAVAGLMLMLQQDRSLALSSLIAFGIYLYAMGCYQNWHGISSYGNRFFVSLTTLFILGLAVFLERLAGGLKGRGAIVAWGGTLGLVLWNLGLIFQWGMHLIPDRGPISWGQAAYNQFAVVPAQAAQSFDSYILHRRQMMDQIEERDLNQIRKAQSHRAGATQ